MLKRLELVGFKSFADKTVFDFGDGITAVVGPNGSGKSNIVDAVRWILGEQSAKSLRGGEMADVIFNGSTSRKSLGLAEVTMIFDNRKRQLPIDAEEVEITRRVYRTGEGEYLLNGNACRLKDQRDLFLGSGLGNDDGCIIAQGKVDILLQASTKDRRAILEEAAGISRFKARKIETQRKLERAEQNLSRARDIVDEVEKQLRSVKLQASKAQRYHEYSTRLRELRVAVAILDFHGWQAKLTDAQQVLDRLRTELDQRAARAGACEAEAERLEFFLADLEDSLREHEARLAQVMQTIKTQETTIHHERSLSCELEEELVQTRRRLAALAGQVQELAQAALAAALDLEQAEAVALTQRQVVHGLQSQLRQVESRLAVLQEQSASDKAEHLELMRRAAHLQNEAVAGKARVDNLRREEERLAQRSTLASENLASIDVELESLVAAETQLQSRLAIARQELADQRQARDAKRSARDRLGDAISILRQKRSALQGRIEVIEGLIRSHEGLGVGVREVFRLLEQPEPGPWRAVLGMIADFLTVKREYAPLIDLALGDWAQRFVVRDMDQLERAFAARPEPFSGRVSFLPLKRHIDQDTLAELRTNRLVEVSLLSRVKQAEHAEVASDHPGLVAPAEQVVSCDHPELTDLPAQLLGRTFLVHDLAAARAIAARVPGLRLVTLDGALLEPDGTLTVGRHHADAGILSRKSELDDLLAQSTLVEDELSTTEASLLSVREELDRLDRDLAEREEQAGVLAEQGADLRGRVERHRERQQGLHEEVALHAGELKKIVEDIAVLEVRWQDAQKETIEAEGRVDSLLSRIRLADDEIHILENDRHDQQEACTTAQVNLATMEERLSSLRGQHHKLARDHQQRQRDQEQSCQTIENARRRMIDSQQTTLNATATLAQAFLDKEWLQRQIQDMIAQRESRRGERAKLAQQAQVVRGEWRAQQELYHQRELEVNDLRHQSESLAEKLHDDYQIILPELYARRKSEIESQPVGDTSGESAAVDAAPAEDRPVDDTTSLALAALDVAAVQDEIAELRKKLARLGSVNMEALAELQDLEKRATEMQAQLDDLTKAKRSLEEIITKINHDSKRLFLDTFNAVRGYFQELFRKLFGGGMADLVLEDEDDVLECGLEIIARPPGKELRSISLMSGGEKTMTAVALLLAVFRSKPAPFCLLDEVDAALDEANIGRFTQVLREFTNLSQFILVTHSKKTMASADILYGITMQESGISKQVAVRFEDWVDEERSEVA